MKNNSLKNRILRITASVLCFCMVFSFFSFLAYFNPGPLSARAEEETAYTEFNTEVTLSNGQFTGSTTSAPTSPSGWTGSYLKDLSGNVVSGIISLDSNYTKNYKDLKLSSYPEFKNDTDIPNTPFGSKSANPITGSYYPGTNKNVLMINTNGSKTAYGYSTSEITLTANSYYKFSAWVKTGLFGDKQGAAITLTGLDQPVGIWNIDTVIDLPTDARTSLPVLDVYNDYGFTEHTIYVATGPNTETVKLMLSVGDWADADHYYLSKGYAFFDNVKAYQMSPTNFHFETINMNESENTLIYDMNPSELLTVSDKNGEPVEAGSFSNGTKGWSKIEDALEDDEWVDPVIWGTYNGAGVFLEDWDVFGLTGDPHTPNGQYDPLRHNDRMDNDIMVLSSFEDDDKYSSVSAGIRSGSFTVEKEKYYRLSVWYNTQNNASATVAVSGQNTSYLGKLGPISNGDLTTDSNTARYGWQRATFYIKGSAFESKDINIELWLGAKGSKSSGVVMFDDITFEEITFRQYNDNLFGGTQVSIDNNSSSGTGVNNGDFAEMDFDEENNYPLAPTGWTFIDPTTSGTTGRSVTATNIEDAIYGATPTYKTHYNQNKNENYAGIENPQPTDFVYDNSNVLLMYSPSDVSTAFGYRSSDITLSAGSDYKLTVSLRTELTGHGAALVLKNGSMMVASIEGIHTNTMSNYGWKDYSFYIAGGGSDATLTLEIWLGMAAKTGKDHKLSSGHMFVNTVSLETLTAAEGATTTEVAARLKEYNETPSPSLLNFAVYKLGAYDFNAYDRYDEEPVKELYDMSLEHGNDTVTRAGVITTLPSGQKIVPSYFYNAHTAVKNRFENSLYLENINRGWSKYSSVNTVNLNAEAFYKVEFSIMVDVETNDDGTNDLSENAVGAGLWLNDHQIKDIRNTYHQPVLHDNNGKAIYEVEFQTYSFYYAVGAETESVKWAISLGGSEFPNQSIAGRAYLNFIQFTEIDKTTFETKKTDVQTAKDDEDIDDITNILIVDNRNAAPTDEPTDEPTDNAGCSSMDWYVIPSILFAVAILIAIGGVTIKRIIAKHPRNKNKLKIASYDRTETVAPVAEKGTEEAEVVKASDSVYEKFDETERNTFKSEKAAVPADKTAKAEQEFDDKPETLPEEKAEPESTDKPEKKPAFSSEFDD